MELCDRLREIAELEEAIKHAQSLVDWLRGISARECGCTHCVTIRVCSDGVRGSK